ncbi:aldo/keto reductase [Fischerella sp. PCC 9605]|uniref:aldo/keto reductase n=1 Tax=Fischerella sp. PCC 9605 TaxID=1173024 RepID=UPI00047C54E6|nr:aldo/keto reductase [Fischerella sp. PCC 9605]
MAVVNAAPYGSGILAKGPDAHARYAYQDAPEGMIARTRRINEVCQNCNVPLAAAALQFCLREARITSTIVGMSRPERLEQTLALAKHPIPDSLWVDIDTIGYETEDPEAGRWG